MNEFRNERAISQYYLPKSSMISFEEAPLNTSIHPGVTKHLKACSYIHRAFGIIRVKIAIIAYDVS